MTRIVVIVGAGRNVGKTLLGEAVTRLASRAGLRVWSVKHVHHGVDYRVKDTGRYLAAGSERVYAIGPDETMMVERRPLSPGEVLEEATRHGVDLVVIEGFRAIVKQLEAYNPLIVCIGLEEPYCKLRLEPGFNPEEAARRILETLGYSIADETS